MRGVQRPVVAVLAISVLVGLALHPPAHAGGQEALPGAGRGAASSHSEGTGGIASPAEEVYTVLHAFAGGAGDGGTPYGSLTVFDGALYGMTIAGGAHGAGTIFRIDPDGTDFSVLHSFPAFDGDGLGGSGDLTLCDGVLYGMTDHSTNGYGVVFKINPDGSGYQLLHSFPAFEGDGLMPYGSLTIGTGVIYGLTSGGGANSDGLVFKLLTDGSGYAVLHSFDQINSSDGRDPMGTLLLVGATLYGTTYYGGAGSDKGTVFRLRIDGAEFSTLHSFAGGPGDGERPRSSLILDAGVLYGMTEWGGASGRGTIFVVAVDGNNYQVLHSFAGGTGDGWGPWWNSLMLDGGLLYGMTTNGGTDGAGVLFRMERNGTGFTVLHSFGGAVGDGSLPKGNLTLDNGVLYGMTSFGGGMDKKGVVFSLAGATCPAITISPTSLSDGAYGDAYPQQTLTASGGSGPYTFTVSSGTLPPGLQLSTTGVLSGTPTAAGTFDFTVEASEPSGCSGRQAYSITVTPRADLLVGILDAPDPVRVGGMLTYTLLVENAGPSNATSVTVTQTLPSGATFTGASGTDWTCGHAGGVVTCFRPQFGAHWASHITVTLTAPSTAGSLSSSVTIAGDGTDPDTSNNASAQTTTCINCPAIAISPTYVPDGVVGGYYVMLTLSATGGVSPYTYSVVSGSLPPGMSLDPSGYLSGVNGLTQEGTFEFTIQATDSMGCPGSRAYSMYVAGPADLGIRLLESPKPLLAGGVLTYTITVSNSGPSTAKSVTVDQRLPDGATFTGASGTGWTCSEAEGYILCTLPWLAASSTASPITVTVTPPSVLDYVWSQVWVGGFGPDPNGANNWADGVSMVAECGDGWPYAVLHGFGTFQDDGYDPLSAPILANGVLYGVTRGGAHSGTVFKINPDGSGYEIVHSFVHSGDPAGRLPAGSLVFDGTWLYGVTSDGPVEGKRGVVYRLSLDGSVIEPLHVFPGADTDGYDPFSLIVHEGVLFGTTVLGGAADKGTIFRINPDGSGYTTLHSFSETDGKWPTEGLTADGGRLYGTTREGGCWNQGVLFSIGTNGGDFRVLGDACKSDNFGFRPLGPLLLDGEYLYGTTQYSGPANRGTIFRIGIDGNGIEVLHNFAGGADDGTEPSGGLTLHDNMLYGVTRCGGSGSDFGDGTVFRVGRDGTGFELLHVFGAVPSDSEYPIGLLTFVDGVLYGAAYGGWGGFEEGVIFSLGGGNCPTITLSPATV
ncbi:MAG TPA: putative Ig domain-containing protein, partial [Thermoanaerobaculaceae bacterium]|nr:putative Ig domain-containing protein [Thermoanaerobaculaceae bacterium]